MAGSVRTRRTGRLLLAIATLLLLVVVIVWQEWPARSGSREQSTHAVRGPDSPTFLDAAQLVAAAQRRGVSCGDRRRFDPLDHVATDSVPYPPPDALSCALPDGTRVYVLAYDRPQDRMNAFNAGVVNLNLCYSSESHRAAAWHAIVAANWRVATPGTAAEIGPLVRAFDGRPAAETISCRFKS
jgi:hypothetical protein